MDAELSNLNRPINIPLLPSSELDSDSPSLLPTEGRPLAHQSRSLPLSDFLPSPSFLEHVVGKMRVVYDTSPTCPVGAPSRDGASNRNLKPAPKVAPPPPTSSRANRRQGIIFNVQALPQELKALQGQSDSKNPAGPA
ncbi:hypothetical protein PGTUg99_009271 [Puccinia graminis f. sp. tritici]|uniref:Uncharacterized protein n=2 Tax=Puccinia graminis f. sp. tritici TaxID=56615 RepID=A0A5B0R684_PUCGR|nr:hypothetical protein PGTUg99_009271 [Puccinia graminis f. sp. tritici]